MVLRPLHPGRRNARTDLKEDTLRFVLYSTVTVSLFLSSERAAEGLTTHYPTLPDLI